MDAEHLYRSHIYMDARMPDVNGWQDRHSSASINPKGAEIPIMRLLEGWVSYAISHYRRYGSHIVYDSVLGPEWTAIGESIRGLLNGETGRLDCGTLDSIIEYNLHIGKTKEPV